MPYRHVDGLEAGDVIWVDFGRPFGHEQAGQRPALIVSPCSYNDRSSLVVVCPITRNVTEWPFKVNLPEGKNVCGAILVDQIRSIDRQQRFVRRFGMVTPDILGRVYMSLLSLLGIPVSN